MTSITSMSFSYIAAEDRIHLAARLDSGRSVRLWLTQRLARSLAGALTTHVEKGAGIASNRVRDVVLAQGQAVAETGAGRPHPVRVDAGIPCHVVRKIALTLSADKVALKFASDLDVAPGLVLTRKLVRQWLGMLHRQFVTAGWPLDVWPAWFSDAGGSAPAGATRH